MNSVQAVTRLEVSLQLRGGGRIEAIYQPYIDSLMEINEKYRAPLYLRYVMSFSLKDTAKQLGKNESTVRSQISRGLSILKKALKEAGYES